MAGCCAAALLRWSRLENYFRQIAFKACFFMNNSIGSFTDDGEATEQAPT